MALLKIFLIASIAALATACPDRVTRERSAAAATLDDPSPAGPPATAGSGGAPGLLDGAIIRDGTGLKDGMTPSLDGRANAAASP